MDAIRMHQPLPPPAETSANDSQVAQNATFMTSDIHNNTNLNSQQKLQSEVQSDKTPKATPAPLPAVPTSTEDAGRPPVYRSISSYNNHQLRAPGHHAFSSHHPEGHRSTDTVVPNISVVPSSPIPNTRANRSVTNLSSQGEHTMPEASSRARESASDRRSSRRRSMIEPTGNHRLSGFFSNLLHLRERDTMSSTLATKQPLPSTNIPIIENNVPVEVPPPSMPPPTLAELGLSLSVLMDDLFSSHFNVPTSGAFLSPNYLLLCHSQGLDVLPLASPPTIQPYALVRRVAFKSVVVMEERGVLVAIAGRRDGVRVYALEEIRKAVEWRIDVELRRELERQRREDTKKTPLISIISEPEKSRPKGKKAKSIDSLANETNTASQKKDKAKKKGHRTMSLTPMPASLPPLPPIPPSESMPRPRLIPRTSVANLHIHREANSRARARSVAEAMGAQNDVDDDNDLDRGDGKGEWVDVRHVDDEILVAAGPSGSAALDERTSAVYAAAAAAETARMTAVGSPATAASPTSPRRRRPANLDLTGANEAGVVVGIPSPAPTLMTLRQALIQSPPTARTVGSEPDLDNEPNTPNGEVISFAEALLESRLPDIPPLGQPNSTIIPAVVTRFPLTSLDPASHGYEGRGVTSNASTSHVPDVETTNSGLVELDGSDEPETEMDHNTSEQRPSSGGGGSMRATRGRRRWSVFDGVLRPPATTQRANDLRNISRSGAGSTSAVPLQRTLSELSQTVPRSPRTLHNPRIAFAQPPPSQSLPGSTHSRAPSSFSRFFHFPKKSRSQDQGLSSEATRNRHLSLNLGAGEFEKRFSTPPLPPPQAPPPKLEYVKLPGTKGSIMIKAVETSRKSFLAILCGEAGEKVELFAGTYRTALGLSRTFILPDSPKTLELQLQGDDLVEVFLVFSQNVFGLEPATVRVREVRIGRAERRAARRRARGANRIPTEDAGMDASGNMEDDIVVNAIMAPSESAHGDSTPPIVMPPQTEETSDAQVLTSELSTGATSSPTSLVQPSTSSAGIVPEDSTLPPLGPPVTPHPDEVAAAAKLLAMGPYTTFQQLSFAPPFPLATLADECSIPPTYQSVLEYKRKFEGDDSQNESNEAGAVVESITPIGNEQWYYKDPRGVVRGPWKSSLMQSWFKDGFLPSDLPVRRANETHYTLLRDLQKQVVDSDSPFRPPPPGLAFPQHRFDPDRPDGVNPLLHPISLLNQEKRFGPPALFFSSRGGHSTSIVDARGRPVLKGRINWSSDDSQPRSFSYLSPPARLGDVKRLEAFEVAEGKAVIVAFRQGGMEAIDIGEAVMSPGDGCRTSLPYFNPPSDSFSRRETFVWKLGEPVKQDVTPEEESTTDLHSVKPSSKAASLTQATPAVAKRRTMLLSGNNGLKGSNGRLVPPEGDAERNDSFDSQEELLVLGRDQNKVYFCDRSLGNFRLLVLSGMDNVE